MMNISGSGLIGNIFIKCVFCFTFLLPMPLTGQVITQRDTISISEVIITRKQISSDQPGFKKYTIDSSVLINYSLFSLTEVLSETSPLFIKCYGSGGSATPSFRGTSAGHTLATWNGININNPMLGQSDFSLLPAGLVDNVHISFGGASMDLGSGGIGGTINLENDPEWANRTTISLNPGAGSFGRYAGLVKIRTGNEHLQSITRAFLNTSRNNFTFLNTETGSVPVWEKRENNQLMQKGIMQEFYVRKTKNVLSARLWYQSSSRNLPGSILYGDSGEKQVDESLRALLNYDILKSKNEFFLATAWMLTNLNYTSQLYSIDSRNTANTIILRGGMTSKLGEYIKLKLILNNELSAIESNNYATGITHNSGSVTISAERKKGNRLGAVILLRETLDGSIILKPDFSAGLEYRIIRGQEHFLKWNVSRNSKIPSLNDRYWNPGGNPELKNEHAMSYELGYKFVQNISQLAEISSEINYFSNFIRDMIQWRPSDYSYWIADNIGSVNSSGFESSLSLKCEARDFLIFLGTGYSFTRAFERDIEESAINKKQLIYIPEHQANAMLRLGYRNFYSIWLTDFTGRKYITDDNSDYLPDYTVNNFITGMQLNSKGSLIDLRFRIENLFNVSYQTIAYYPQPGRSFFLTLSFQLNK